MSCMVIMWRSEGSALPMRFENACRRPSFCSGEEGPPPERHTWLARSQSPPKDQRKCCMWEGSGKRNHCRNNIVTLKVGRAREPVGESAMRPGRG